MTIQPGRATQSSVMYEKRRSRAVSSLQPTRPAVAAVISPPTSTMAPSTCTKSARSTSWGRMAASISGTRLEDHVEEQEQEEAERREVQQHPGRCTKTRGDLFVGRAALGELLHAGVVRAGPC